jgi:hypothetical protein
MSIHEQHPDLQLSTGKSLGWLQRALCLITCVDLDLLEKSPAWERKKYVSLGAAMLVTTLLAFVSGYLAFDYLFPVIDNSDLSLWFKRSIAIVAALIWMLVIFNLQRFVIAGDGNTADRDQSGPGDFLRALPAILAATVMGIAVAIPLELWLFEDEITVFQLEQGQGARMVGGHRPFFEESLTEECGKFYRHQLQQQTVLLRCLPRSANEKHPLSGARVQATTDPGAPSDASLVAEPDRVKTALRRVAELQRNEELIRERQHKMLSLEQSLTHRAGMLFEQMPYFAYAVLFVVIFMQLTPVLIKMMSAKSPYDYLRDMTNRLSAASGSNDGTFNRARGGIEIDALAIFDQQGNAKKITLYHHAVEVEDLVQQQIRADSQQLAAERLQEMRRRYARLEALTAKHRRG